MERALHGLAKQLSKKKLEDVIPIMFGDPKISTVKVREPL
jgi:hypothetical protein